MDKKLAVYICTGCGIGDTLNIEALGNVATKEYKAPICKTGEALCSPEGAALIIRKMMAKAVDHQENFMAAYRADLSYNPPE